MHHILSVYGLTPAPVYFSRRVRFIAFIVLINEHLEL